MSRTLLYFLIVLISACELGDNPAPQGPSWGFVSAKMNGKEWTKTYHKGFKRVWGFVDRAGTAIPCDEEFYSIMAELYTREGYLRQNLYLTKIPLDKGRYEVLPFVLGHCDENDPMYAVLHTSIDDGCVAGDRYDIMTSEENYLQIDSYDHKSTEIKGTFQLTFIITDRGADHVMPDTLRFTEGKFHTKILDLRN